ncbi:MAG: hypothetical protein ACW976_02275 [Candidatus Ranarchaeia archaeon]|jgi:hypothetical protein
MSTMIVNVSLYKYKWRFNLPEGGDRQSDIHLVLSEVDNVLEHENVVSDPAVLRNVTEWIRDRGFLHPILATKYQDRYVIADGTHRTLALRDIKARDDPGPLYTPIMDLQTQNFTRGSWALMFDEGLPPLDQVLEGSWQSKEVQFKSVTDLMELFSDDHLGVVLKKQGKIFGLYSTTDTRYDFLKSLKTMENRIKAPSRYLIARDAIGLESDYLMFSPPKEGKQDLSLLVEHPELRRSKGSRTILPVRPMFLPIPLNVLRLPQEEGIEQIARIIDQSIDNNSIRVVTPDLKGFNFCGEIWDDYMIIFDLDLVYRCIPHDIDSHYLDRLESPEITRVH